MMEYIPFYATIPVLLPSIKSVVYHTKIFSRKCQYPFPPIMVYSAFMNNRVVLLYSTPAQHPYVANLEQFHACCLQRLQFTSRCRVP
jgi:hypothetical protein